jgi:hypothetical protein
MKPKRDAMQIKMQCEGILLYWGKNFSRIWTMHFDLQVVKLVAAVKLCHRQSNGLVLNDILFLAFLRSRTQFECYVEAVH